MDNIVIYKSDTGDTKIDVKLENDTVWLSQKQMGDLFNKDIRTVNEHISNIYSEKELSQSSTIREFRIVQKEGNREIERNIKHYNLDVVISVGYRVKSKRGTQFRIWATNVLKEHLINGCINTIYQTFSGEELYPSIEEKASNLLYFLVKDHPFVDGNKRIAAFLFIWFLDKNNVLYREDETKRIADNALVAMTLMIAESKPNERELIMKIVINLINRIN